MNRVLAIETSCDETAVALVELPIVSPGELVAPKVIAERISSQIALHAQYGGVVPELAAREHLKMLPILVQELWEFDRSQLPSAIAVTTGPGLKGSLLAGVEFARGYALARDLALLGVNHIEAHLLSPILEYGVGILPYLGLIVSGGHSEIIAVHGVGRYELIERTIDDAAGEAFDKCGALLGIPYPGGARLAKLADGAHDSSPASDSFPAISWSRAQLSFSGLKTSFRLAVEKTGLRSMLRSEAELSADPHIAAACSKAQQAIVSTLVHRVRVACEKTGLQNLGVAGGVAANSALKQGLEQLSIKVLPVPLKWCGDNAAMIGAAALLRSQVGRDDRELTSSLRARWPIEEMNQSKGLL